MTEASSNKIAVQCPHCGRKLAVDPAHLGRKARCPKCTGVFVLQQATSDQATAPASPDAPVAAAGALPDQLCPICQTPLAGDAALTTCADCHTQYHLDCWEFNKGCGIYGCPQVPQTEKQDALEVPAAYWGQEEKACPRCGKIILAAAVRCRFCGATFETARPQDVGEYHSRTAVAADIPRVKKACPWLLVFSLIPCTAPFAAVFDLIWWIIYRAAIRELPTLHRALYFIALGAAVGQTALIILVAMIHAAAS